MIRTSHAPLILCSLDKSRAIQKAKTNIIIFGLAPKLWTHLKRAAMRKEVGQRETANAGMHSLRTCPRNRGKITEDPYIAHLIGLRVSDSAYVGGTSRDAPYIGMDIAQAVIPDEALEHLKIPEILEYREKAKDAYTSWIAEVNKAAAEIGNIGDGISSDEIAKIIATDFTPRVIEYRNDMCAIRDDIFSDVMKKVVKWEAPALSLAYFSSLSIAGAVTLFATALAPAVPDIIDYFKDKKDIERRNTMSYLIKLSKISSQQ